MIPRYEHAGIAALASDEAKIARWDAVELAVIGARVNLGQLETSKHSAFTTSIKDAPFDLSAWYALEKELGHDLGAYVELRQRVIPAELRDLFHKDMTSYDVEDPAFALMLIACNHILGDALDEFLGEIASFALKYRDTPLLERTHGQWAKLASLGGRFLTYHVGLDFARTKFLAAAEDCRLSRISGAIGNYGGGLSPDLERDALSILKLIPFYGATQIMPRVIYAALAQSLVLIAGEVGKIAMDVRLGARSGIKLWEEPFGKKQKGSSAMPHKKNTIATEQMAGIERLVRANAAALVENISTWERRAIEQSSVERIAWPDLYQLVLRMLGQMTKVIKGLVVYPENLRKEIDESRGTYASDEAKNFLAAELARRGEDAADAYRIVQLAAWNSLSGQAGIDVIIPAGRLEPNVKLEATHGQVQNWNVLLTDLFGDELIHQRWKKIFSPAHVLRNEAFLFKQILDA